MNRKQFKVEEIVNKLREADVLVSKRQMVAWACKHVDVTVDASRAYKCPTYECAIGVM